MSNRHFCGLIHSAVAAFLDPFHLLLSAKIRRFPHQSALVAPLLANVKNNKGVAPFRSVDIKQRICKRVQPNHRRILGSAVKLQNEYNQIPFGGRWNITIWDILKSQRCTMTICLLSLNPACVNQMKYSIFWASRSRKRHQCKLVCRVSNERWTNQLYRSRCCCQASMQMTYW